MSDHNYKTAAEAWKSFHDFAADTIKTYAATQASIRVARDIFFAGMVAMANIPKNGGNTEQVVIEVGTACLKPMILSNAVGGDPRNN